MPKKIGDGCRLRAARALLVALLAWGAFAFGAVYAWAFVPLICGIAAFGAIVLLATGPARNGGRDAIPLVAALVTFAVAAALQLVPARLERLARASPETVRVLRELDPSIASGAVTSHAISIAPPMTAAGLALFASMAILLLSSARLFSTMGGRGFAKGLAAVGVLLALAGIIQQPFYAGKVYGLWKPIGAGAAYGPFVNKNHFAGWMLMAIPLALGLLCGSLSRAMRGVRPNWRDRLAWFSSRPANQLVLVGAAAVVMSLSLVLTMSRSGISALALAVAVTGAVVMRHSSTRTRASIAVAYLVFLVVVIVAWVGADALAVRFSQADWGDYNGRRGAWADAQDVARRFALTGTGLNTYGVAELVYQRRNLAEHFNEAHNDYLQLAAEGGWLLCAPAALCVVSFGALAWKRFRSDVSSGTYWLRVGAVTGIVAIAFQETVEFSLQMPGNAALFAVLCGIAIHRQPTERGPAHRPASTSGRAHRPAPTTGAARRPGPAHRPAPTRGRARRPAPTTGRARRPAPTSGAA